MHNVNVKPDSTLFRRVHNPYFQGRNLDVRLNYLILISSLVNNHQIIPVCYAEMFDSIVSSIFLKHCV